MSHLEALDLICLTVLISTDFLGGKDRKEDAFHYWHGVCEPETWTALVEGLIWFGTS